MNSLNQVLEYIKDNNQFILMGHLNPDGDCIGSLLALKRYLDSLNKKSYILLAEDPGHKYDILNIEPSEYVLFENIVEEEWHNAICITLDSGDFDRLGDGQEIAEKRFIINIDHHIDNPGYGDINYINSNKAAVGEIIYDLLKIDGFKLDKEIGTAIGMAIIADTGGLRYQNTTADIFRIMSQLTEIGVDIYGLNKAIFGSYEYSSVKLKGMALSTLTLHENGKIAYLRVEKEMYNQVDADFKESSGLVNYARDIRGVEVGIVFTEVSNNETRVGFRSNNYCPVNEIAAFFDGGGHPRAAGCTIYKDITEAQKMVLNKVEEYVTN